MKQPIEVTVRDLADILETYLDADSRVNYAIKIVGHPGIGKSEIVRQAARKKNHYFIDTRLAFKENIDLGGYPVPDHVDRRMIYYRPKFIPPVEVPGGYNGILWFLDEANRAHPTVIQTLFQIITERRCGEHELPDKTAIVLSGNLGEMDRTTVTDFEDSALDGRLALFHLKPNARDWLQWADQEKIQPAVIRYISLFPDKLWDERNINPNPRGWHQVSQALRACYKMEGEEDLSRHLTDQPDSPLKKLICSLVGLEAGTDFLLQYITPRELTTAEVLDGSPDKLEKLKQNRIPAEDLLWALSGAITHLRELGEDARESRRRTDLRMLANVLQFIGFSRADVSMSFFYLLLRDCGLFTSIPAALKAIENRADSDYLLAKFEDLIRPKEDSVTETKNSPL
ncbi:MAG: hypothetical protein ABIK15_09520 [Pseudomonadota bacterium]